MCVVDMHRICRCNMIKVLSEEQDIVDGSMQIIPLTDWICGNPHQWTYKMKKN